MVALDEKASVHNANALPYNNHLTGSNHKDSSCYNNTEECYRIADTQTKKCKNNTKHTHAHRHTSIHTHKHTNTHKRTHTHTHTQAYIHTHTHTHKRTHIHTHASILTFISFSTFSSTPASPPSFGVGGSALVRWRIPLLSCAGLLFSQRLSITDLCWTGVAQIPLADELILCILSRVPECLVLD